MADESIQKAPSSAPSLPASVETPPDAPPWPPAAQWSVAVFLGLGLLLFGWRGWGLSRYSTRPLPLERGRALVDLNRADEVDLQLIPGIGPALARRIIEQRPYVAVDELRRVPGVGPEILSRLRPYVYAGEVDPGERPPPRVVRGKAVDVSPVYTRKNPPTEPIDLNNATQEQLQSLPGIGPTLAKRIVEARGDRGFSSLDDLRRVRGIGVKTLDKLRPHLIVRPRKQSSLSHPPGRS